jgi:protein SCO1
VDFGRTKEQRPASIDWLTGKPLSYDVYHSDDLIFLDGSGRQRFIINADPDVQGHNPPQALVKFLDSEGLTSLNRPNPVADWTVSQGVSVFSWLLNRRLAVPQ